ncbi:MAG TPA: type II toxin-antitoxin system RelE/ParE family toxin [Spirochaetota bacterium]|nr:type II toxin-antitoxin system RelE/ParE family toxin [Spirochaetota bacterium]
MKYTVVIISEAENDILDIYQYIIRHDSAANADHVFEQIEEACYSLEEFPERGHIPPELDTIGISAYREIHFKPYQVIYEIDGKNIFIHCILDGRRDLQQLLERRLLR